MNLKATNTDTSKPDFFVAAYEAGAEHPALPTWANHKANLAALAPRAAQTVTRQDLAQVPGAFQLLNVLSPAECQQLIQVSESMGYLADAAVSLPRDVRHNDSLTWVVDKQTDGLIWNRVKHLMTDEQGLEKVCVPLNISLGIVILGRKYTVTYSPSNSAMSVHFSGT